MVRLAFLLPAALLSQIPARDSRNFDRPHTDSTFAMPEYRTRAEWEGRREHLRKRILSSAGLLPMPDKTPLHPRVVNRVEQKDYSIETVLLETMPGYYLGGNLYRPRGRSGKLPAIASPHGHWIWGRLENSQTGSIPARGINLARQGYVVFTYDMVGYNDTVQTPHAFEGDSELLWSFGPLGLQLWNSIRVVDYLASLPDVDPERIGATGASGGGTQTFLLAAVDPRVKFSAPVNMISSIMQGGSPCENAPRLRIEANNMEFGALMAPRPMIMVSATGDWTRNTPKVEFPAVQSIYKLYGAAGSVETVQIDAPHNYNQQSREAVYRFFAKTVLGDSDAAKYAERSYRVEPLPAMLALHNRTLPENALTYEQVRAQWIREAARQNEAATPAELRERLKLAVLAEDPARVLSQAEGERVWLSRPGVGDRVPALWIKGKGPSTVVVHEAGSQAARASAAALIKEGRNLLLIDAYQTGAAAGPRDEPKRHHSTFNRSEDANRAQDILTAAAFLKQQGAVEVRLVGYGKGAVWAMFAAAVSDLPLKLESQPAGFAGDDASFKEQFFVPGIQRAGGVRAARQPR